MVIPGSKLARPRSSIVPRLWVGACVLALGLSATAHPLAAAPVRRALPSISIDDVTVTEGDAGTVSATFKVTSSERGKATVSFATVAGSAKSAADFVAREGKVRFAGRKLERKISITVNGDLLDEADETFEVVLSGAVGATITDDEGLGTIEDDDPPPTVSVPATASVPEGNDGDVSYAVVDITLDAPSGRTVSVDFSTADGTATAGNDYTATSGGVSFAPGETVRTVLVDVAGDGADESNETFTLDLSVPTHADLGNDQTVITITDNDPAPPGTALLAIDGGQVREGTSGTKVITFTVTRSGETTTAVTTGYSTLTGTADDADFQTATGSLPFAANQTTATFDVTVNGDKKLEHDELFLANLESPSAGVAYLTPQATGRIVNDDTRTTVKARARASRVTARGLVSPQRAGRKVVVRLFRRKGGSWDLIGTRRTKLSGTSDVNGDTFTDSRYTARFTGVKANRCKVKATYRGDGRFAPSADTRTFRC
ncbi:MAG TPA: Calx-beta domain-containing protein [Actinomycetota bacterium]|nr:Calx-beta domain-containing protein [Actinomycetota bacterium]